MRCESCNKNPATVHLTEIRNGEKTELHYCEPCAQSEGVNTLMTPQSFLSQLVEPNVAGGHEVEIRCPQCGLSYAEFRQRGRLGCGEDYRLFGEGLRQLLERIHGSTQHLGKVPGRVGQSLKRERELIELRRELSQAIQREQYEQAAELRDRIRILENGVEEEED
jgi:protein arginine kinase activator